MYGTSSTCPALRTSVCLLPSLSCLACSTAVPPCECWVARVPAACRQSCPACPALLCCGLVLLRVLPTAHRCPLPTTNCLPIPTTTHFPLPPPLPPPGHPGHPYLSPRYPDLRPETGPSDQSETTSPEPTCACGFLSNMRRLLPTAHTPPAPPPYR
jgi:hypothetical protein